MNARLPPSRRTNGVPVPQLADLRKQVGLSQRALARRAGLSMQTISRLEHGANARYDTIELLAQALDVLPARLIRAPRRGRNTLPGSPNSDLSTR
ncbi:MAG TPA: helix-turn-helix transcriptional regulator [Ktedonobacteraceae bacterium]|nr:helix-turn-helix transcriptional regulator [Ktedonobacteraceae bacterium]